MTGSGQTSADIHQPEKREPVPAKAPRQRATPLPWFRFYTEFSHDPKVQMMSEPMQRRLVMLFCLQGAEELDAATDEELAFILRVDANELAKTKALFLAKGFIDSSGRLANWNKRQCRSDGDPTGAERQQRHRERTRNALRNDTITRTEERREEKSRREKTKDKKTAHERAPDPPEGVSVLVFSDFLKVRKSKRAAWTNTAEKAMRREADKADISLETAMQTCCERGWAGFKASWLDPDKTTSVNQKKTGEPAWRTEQRRRMERAVPGIAEKPLVDHLPPEQIFEMEAVNGNAIAIR
jgi:hypothetical protein